MVRLHEMFLGSDDRLAGRTRKVERRAIHLGKEIVLHRRFLLCHVLLLLSHNATTLQLRSLDVNMDINQC